MVKLGLAMGVVVGDVVNVDMCVYVCGVCGVY